jgi:glutamate formiminotransferase
MNITDYVTIEEVQRVCRELGFRDWTQLNEPVVLPEEAEVLQKEVGAEALQISMDEFRKGLEVELEHGLFFPDANVTNNHPVLTARIVLAHLKEMLDYYARLEVAELEGDMLKAALSGDQEKLARKYTALLAARRHLSQWESEQGASS